MTTHRITVDPSLCSGFGSCVDLAPGLFRLGADGIASSVVVETDDPAALEAAAACPMAAISVLEVDLEREAA
jgi:ferredoxin